jgi:Cu-processing system ATP-binding protein
VGAEERPVITFDAFTKRFGSHPAVAALSLTVARGEVVALLGPNGSGKTTSLKAAAGLVVPTEGRVLLGEPPRTALDAAARRVTSFLPQKVAFPDALSGMEVVTFFAALRGVEAPNRPAEVLRFAALNGAADRAVGTYSGGMAQRLGLAVAVLPDAPILLLDEPTAALDPDGLSAFYGLVERHRDEGRTVLFTSHQLGDVERLADRVAVLVEGRLVATFTESELASRLADRGVMRLRIGACPADLLERLRPVAPRASWAGRDLVVPGEAAARPAVVAALQAAGAEVLSLSAEEGRLDAFYRELVGGSS